MISMTYGKMPTRKQFRDAWAREVGKGKTYAIRSGAGRENPFAGDWTEIMMFKILQITASEIRRGRIDVDDETATMASAILGTLGFEWI